MTDVGSRGPKGGRGGGLPITLIKSIVLKFGVTGLNAVTGIVTARALNPAGRGELAAMIIWPMLFGGLATIGLPASLVYHIRKHPERTAGYVGWALTLSVGFAMVATLLGWLIIPVWLRQQPPHIIWAAQLCILGAVLSTVTLTGRAAWEARGAFTTSNLSQVLLPFIIVLGLFAQVALGTLTPVTAAATYVGAGAIPLIGILYSVIKTCRPSFAGGVATLRQLMHYGSRSYGVDLCGYLSIYLDQALVVGLLNSEAMGIYAVALSLARVIGAVHGSVAMMAFPRAVGLEARDMATAIGRSARMGLLAGAALGLCVVAAGPMLLHRLYGPAFDAASHILPILVCETMVSGVSQILMQGFLASGRPGVATAIQVGGLVVSVPLFLLLVPVYGVTGASFALLATSTIRLVLTMVAYPLTLTVAVPRVWITAADLADLGRYRFALFDSLSRLRAVGGTK